MTKQQWMRRRHNEKPPIIVYAYMYSGSPLLLDRGEIFDLLSNLLVAVVPQKKKRGIGYRLSAIIGSHASKD